jgi:glycosyltransferase involved in cell wall biosynthesis
MPQISVVIIALNEEQNIGRCLDSVVGVADDVVVVDSFSTDRTEEICKAKGARFIQHAFEGHIEQKNWAITQAKYPHVLSLDADEALSDELKKSILEVKANWTHDGYTMNRLNNYAGQWIRHSGWYPDRKLRLFDNRKGAWGGYNPHDKYSMTTPGAAVGHLKGDLLHYAYHSVEAHKAQLQKFSEIAANAFFKAGKKATFEKRYLSPGFRFLRNYIIKLGFLDGKHGLNIAWNEAVGVYRKYKKLEELNSVS